MIANFYKRKYPGDYNKARFDLLASKNIEHIPALKTIVTMNGQLFSIDRIYFNLENCEYDIFMVRA